MRLRGGQRVTVADRVVEIPPAPRPIDPRVAAADLLRATDHVEFRAWTPDRTPSVAWLAWREALRAVVRGDATDIPDEPERYGAPQPAPPPPPPPPPEPLAPVVPEALTGFVLVGEAPAQTKARLAGRWVELTHLLQMGLATPEQSAEHTALSRHQSWLQS